MYNLFIFRLSFNLLRNISLSLLKSIFYREFDFSIKYISFNFFNLFCFKKIIELKKINNISINLKKVEEKYINIILKTLGFTYLNPHVYSDTVFFLGNFSKDFIFINKIYFGIGASISSFIFFFTLGYLSKLFSKHLANRKAWISINIFIILFMISIIFYVLGSIF